jgi:chemotaxis methyl-accepting protein methylase
MIMNSTALFQTIAIAPCDFSFISLKLRELAGIHLSEKKCSLVVSRLRARLLALGLRDFSEYRNYLANLPIDHHEWQQMINELTTNKTDFFREPSHFDYLVETFLPAWEKQADPKRPFRAWSAACSTGEEPYTLAIVLNDYFKGKRSFEITASDIDTEALSHAKNGVYPRQRIMEIPQDYHSQAIDFGVGRLASWGRIRDELHRRVRFEHLNLTSLSYPLEGSYDVIFCRNVFIYFKPETIQSIVNRFHRHGSDFSALIIGHSETLQNIRSPWKYVAPSIFKSADSV